MKKSVLKVTKLDAFAMGKIQGTKETFEEILEYLSTYPDETFLVRSVKVHIKSRLKYIVTSNITDTLKQRRGI